MCCIDGKCPHAPLPLRSVSRCNLVEPSSLMTLATALVVPEQFKSLDVRENPLRSKKRTVMEVMHTVKKNVSVEWTESRSKAT